MVTDYSLAATDLSSMVGPDLGRLGAQNVHGPTRADTGRVRAGRGEARREDELVDLRFPSSSPDRPPLTGAWGDRLGLDPLGV